MTALDHPSAPIDLRGLLRAPGGMIARAFGGRLIDPMTVAICDIDGERHLMLQHRARPMSSRSLVQCFEDDHGRALRPLRLASPESRPLMSELPFAGSRSSRERSWAIAQATLDALPRGAIVDASAPSARALWGLVIATKVSDTHWLLVDDLGTRCAAAEAWLDGTGDDPDDALAEEDLSPLRSARFEALTVAHQFQQVP